MDAASIRSRPEGFFWLWSPPARQNERHGSVAVVHVRGPLEHHTDSAGADSYDDITERVRCATLGDDDVGPPSAIVLRIDSPGGVVSGLTEATARIKRTAGDIPLVAYVDEMAASAAYCLACACDEIVCPRSAILGSIGVISTMVSQAEQDEAMGLQFVTITSGERKADGHPHHPIEADAVAAERKRVDELAKQFWSVVSKARGLPVETIAGYQAGIFLGKAASKAGLADRVTGWDELLSSLQDDSVDKKERVKLDTTTKTGEDSLAQRGKQGARSERMSLKALIKRTKAAIATENDPAKLASLASDLAAYRKSEVAAYKKVEKHVEHTKSEEGDEDEEDEDEESAKGNETDRGDDEEDDEEDDDAKKSSKKTSKKASPEMDEKKAMLAVYQAACAATGKTGKGAAGAIAALVSEAKAVPALRERIAKIEQNERKAKRDGMVGTALAERRLTPHEAKTLGGKSIEFVTDFLEMRPNALVSNLDEELSAPSGQEHADLPQWANADIESALASMSSASPEAKVAMKTKLVDAARTTLAASNGAAVGRH